MTVRSMRPGGRLWLRVMLGLLLGLLVGCAGRGRAPDSLPPPDDLGSQAALETLAVWKQRLGDYIEREGNGDAAVLSQTRDLRSRHRQRPASITFSALDIGSTMSGVDGRDVTGLLLGLKQIAGETWYLFLVGTVQRADYRPVGIQDLRLAAFSTRCEGLRWQVGHRDLGALHTYRDLPADTLSVRFPGNRDRFAMTVTDSLVQVREQRSGAQWMLRFGKPPGAGLSIRRRQ